MNTQTLLQQCVEAVDILSPTAFMMAGRTREAADGDLLVRTLTETIYEQCYCNRFAGDYHVYTPVSGPDPAFAAALSAANTTMTGWDGGWEIDQLLPGGQYLAVRRSRYRRVSPGEFITTSYQAALPQPGTPINIYCQKESSTLQAAFYFAFSQEPVTEGALSTTVRFYWNVKSSGAPALMELLTTNLNRYQIPFSFKCLNHPGLYPRIDPAVLYIARRYYQITYSIIRCIYPAIRSQLESSTPWFTKSLDPGLGLAEDPGSGDSFGMSRCRMVAEGIYQAYQLGDGSSARKREQVETIFKARGLSLDRPWLNAGSKDIYDYCN
jgi:hypothetical protein